jgi:1-acyl-sn-glycerol-3-phosphate acyltransferase
VIRLVAVALAAVPWTIWLTLGIVWAARRRSPDLACICEAVPRRWATLLLRAAGVRVVVENARAIDPGRPQVVVVNHVSWFDVLAICKATPGRYLFVAKKEVRKVPFLGRAAEVCGHIYVDRSNHQAALESLAALRGRLAEEKPTIIMFPEGTRSESGELQPFKKGAFVLAIQAGADVVPAAVLGSRAVMPKHSLLIRPGTITVRFGEPIAVAGMELGQRDRLIQESREALARLLAAPANP